MTQYPALCTNLGCALPLCEGLGDLLPAPVDVVPHGRVGDLRPELLLKLGQDRRPAVPEYCLRTPADVVPFVRKPVSSMISTP